jgi:hypothetical protein
MKRPCDNFLSPGIQPLDVYTVRTTIFAARSATVLSMASGVRIVGQAGKNGINVHFPLTL